MQKSSIERIRELTAQLNRWRHEYYNLNAPTITDAQYDRLYDELERLEQETGCRMCNSPTQTVGYEVVDGLEKTTHATPLLSLEKTKQMGDLMRFIGAHQVLLMHKLDGLTLKLEYENGSLVRASTRGNGEEGENQIWGTDITYIRLRSGFMYLAAFMDWHSRYVISWELSDTLEVEFVLKALRRALSIAVPEIINSDQGSQYTANDYIALLKENDVKISMDGRGRCMDNIFTERLWRSLKYQEVYLHDYESPREARVGITRYFELYNTFRPHQRLGGLTPHEVYFGYPAYLNAMVESK